MKIYHRDYEDLSPGRSYVLASDYDAREKEYDIELSDAAMREQALTAELASALVRIQELEDREDALEADLANERERVREEREHKYQLELRIAKLEAALRRADDIEHSISAEDWYRERDTLLGSSVETECQHRRRGNKDHDSGQWCLDCGKVFI